MDGSACLLIEGNGIEVRQDAPVARFARAIATPRRPLSPVCDHVLGEAPPDSLWRKPWAHTGIPLACSIFIHAMLLTVGLISYRAADNASRINVLVDSPLTMADGPAGAESLSAPIFDLAAPTDVGAIPTFESTVPRDPLTVEHSLSAQASNTAPVLDDAPPMLGVGAIAPEEGDATGTAAPAQIARIAPPTRTEFFGVSGNARTVVFVCDASGSMLGTNDLVANELQRSILALHPSQHFNVIYISGNTPQFYTHSSPPAADAANKLAACNFAQRVQCRGRTIALPAMAAALECKPDLIYVISDGDFDDTDAVIGAVHQMDGDKGTRIHVVVVNGGGASADASGFAALKSLADETSGTCRVIDPNAVRTQ